MNKLIKAFFYSCIILCLFSCKTSLDEFNKKNSEYINVNFFVTSSNENNAKGVLIPDFNNYKKQVASYEIIITKKSSPEDNPIVKNVEASNPELSVYLMNQVEYSIITTGIDNDDKPILKGTSDFIPTAENSSFKLKVSPYQDEEISGSLKITIDFPFTGKEYSIKLPTINDSTSYSVDCTQSSQKLEIPLIENLTPGGMQILFEITEKDSNNKIHINQSAIIYSGMISSLCFSTGSSSSSITLSKNELVPFSLDDYDFYVFGKDSKYSSVDDATSGLSAKKLLKFNSLGAAVKTASSGQFASKKRTIYVDGIVEENVPEDKGSFADSIIVIGNGTTPFEVKIVGVSSNSCVKRNPSEANNARIFEVKQNANVTLENISISNGFSSGNGGAISNSGTLTLNDVSITDSNAIYGGAISLESNSSLTCSNGSITSCNASNSGGGIYCASNTSCKISNMSFVENTAKNSGGALYLASKTGLAFTMNGGVIKSNYVVNGCGGAVTAYGNKNQVVFNNVEFFDNTASGTADSKGEGGAIFIPEISYLSLTNCYLHDNTSGMKGGDVCAKGTLTLSGTTAIGDVFVSNNPIQVSDDIASLNKLAFANIYPNTYTDGAKILQAQSPSSLTPEIVNNFTLAKDADHVDWIINAQGLLELTKKIYDNWDTLCSDIADLDDDSKTYEFYLASEITVTQALESLVPIKLIPADGGTTINCKENSNFYTFDRDNITLEGTIDNQFTFSGNGISTSSIVNLGYDSTFIAKYCNFNDCSSSVKSGTVFNVNGNNPTSPALLTLLNCNFNDCNNTGSGGGIIYSNSTVAEGANITITDCAFINCTSAFVGGAINAENSLVTIENSSFENCNAKMNGGAIYAGGQTSNKGKLICRNTTFINNSTQDVSGSGDSIYLNNCNAYLTNVIMESSNANSKFVYLPVNNSSLTLSGLTCIPYIDKQVASTTGWTPDIFVGDLTSGSNIVIGINNKIEGEKLVKQADDSNLDFSNILSYISIADDNSGKVYQLESDGTYGVLKQNFVIVSVDEICNQIGDAKFGDVLKFKIDITDIDDLGSIASFITDDTISVSLDISGSSITEIPKTMFQSGESLVEIILPEKLETIGQFAFQKCTRLTYIEIPATVTLIGTKAFVGAGVETVVFKNVNGWSIDGGAVDVTNSSVNAQKLTTSDSAWTRSD